MIVETEAIVSVNLAFIVLCVMLTFGVIWVLVMFCLLESVKTKCGQFINKLDRLLEDLPDDED